MKMLALLLLLSLQEPYPAEDHSWLRFKPGTWIKYRLVMNSNGSRQENLHKFTFKEKGEQDFSIEEVATVEGKDQAPVLRKNSFGTIVGKETLVIDGKEHPCSIAAFRAQNLDGVWEVKHWMPKGNKAPLKAVFKQPGMEGEVVAVAVDERLKICGREYACAKLQGKVKLGPSSATMTVWLTTMLPSAQARLELKMDGPREAGLLMEPIEIHEEK